MGNSKEQGTQKIASARPVGAPKRARHVARCQGGGRPTECTSGSPAGSWGQFGTGDVPSVETDDPFTADRAGGIVTTAGGLSAWTLPAEMPRQAPKMPAEGPSRGPLGVGVAAGPENASVDLPQAPGDHSGWRAGLGPTPPHPRDMPYRL